MKPSWLVLSSIFVASFYVTEVSSAQSVSQPESSVKKSCPSRKQHQCGKCAKRFQGKYYLTRHIKAVHEKQKLFECPKCEKTFSENGNLIQHINSVHNKCKPFKCLSPGCSKVFAQNSNFKKHIKAVHDKQKPFECPKCKKTFSQNSTLKRHIKVVHEKCKPVQCPGCKKTFSQKYNLTRHRPSCPKTTASPTEDNTTDLSLLGSALLSNRIDTNHFDLPLDFDNDPPARLGLDPELVVPLTLPNTQVN